MIFIFFQRPSYASLSLSSLISEIGGVGYDEYSSGTNEVDGIVIPSKSGSSILTA
jgi:hypothetical protein